MNKSGLSLLYLFFDLAGSLTAWLIFCNMTGLPVSAAGEQVHGLSAFPFKSAILVPAGWALLFFFSGFYSFSLKRSRLQELIYSVAVNISGAVILFFILLIKRYITGDYITLHTLLLLFSCEFIFTYLPRIFITTLTARGIHRGQIGYNTLILGSGRKALNIYRRIKEEKIPGGNIIKGYVKINGNSLQDSEWDLSCLGRADDILKIINDYRIEEVIIAAGDNEFDDLLEIIGQLQLTDVTIKAIPSLKDLLIGRVKHTSILGTPLLEIPNRPISATQLIIKHTMDYLLSLLMLIFLFPLIIALVLIIRFYDNGPVLFLQERVGKNGCSFKILKFRSMREDAEKEGPMLSGKDDPRITPVGRFMRKHRLDEIPNLINVLKGEMSLVGPRPEREFYIKQIIKKAPHFRRLLKVKPGITSWGQVKYGYASNVDQMIERLEYDLVYLDNMNLMIDLKILIYTIIIILSGKGI